MASNSAELLRTPLRRHDPDIKFEEYLHFALISRAREGKSMPVEEVFAGNPWDFLRRRSTGPTTLAPQCSAAALDMAQEIQGEEVTREQLHVDADKELASDVRPVTPAVEHGVSHEVWLEELAGGIHPVTPAVGHGVSHAEWLKLARATRNASWSALFFLITTDMFGPLSVPWSISQLGYGPGVSVYTVFGALAGYAGYQLWSMYIHLDSDRYPLRTYGDLAFRVFGGWARHIVNILQSFQLFFDVALLTLANGQGISQLVKGKVCFIVCVFIFCCAGCVLGQIRTLRTFGWLANLSIILNLLILCICMGVAAHSEPNYAAAEAQSSVQPGPIITSAGVPKSNPFEYQVIGLMQAVYSYAASMLFCEFMSEMRRPWDFWKSLLCAQTFIYCLYLLYGLFMYSYQGQFVVLISNQGLSPYTWQSITNGMGLVSALILACLYGNVGIKVLYSNIGIDLLNFPELTTFQGKLIFAGAVPLYWIIAFVVGSAVPSITNLSSLVAAICVLQFSFTFPPILMLGFRIQKDSILPEERFDPVTGEVFRVDGGLKRWIRGVRKNWPLNLWNTLFALGSAATAGLGVYASVVELIFVFKYRPAQSSFSCTNPVGA